MAYCLQWPLLGFLFSKDALPQRVAHGATVELGMNQWQACIKKDCLVLSMTIQTDDKKEQASSRIANIKREVEGRQKEVDALTEDIARVINEAEKVP